MTRLLAVIPARSGSKSLPDKNIKALSGKPLIAYSIEYALRCPLVAKTIVSTDSQQYADIAREFGASVPFIRPAQYAKDESQDYDFMRHALDFFTAQDNHYDVLALLRPTSPLRPAGLIEQGMDILNNNPEATSVRSVAEVKEHPYRVWHQCQDGSIAGVVDTVDEPYNLPRQQLPPRYFQTGDLELVRASTLLNGSVSGKKVFPLFLEHRQMVDIDNASDFNVAEQRVK